MKNELSNEDRLASQMEADDRNPGAWELDPAGEEPRPSLGSQVSIRLNPDQAEKLRRVAKRKGIGYTSLLRSWIEERLRTEEQRAVALDAFTVNIWQAAFTIQEQTNIGHAGRAPRRPLVWEGTAYERRL